MKNLKVLVVIITTFLASAAPAYATSHGSAPMIKEESSKTVPVAAADMAEGEIRKVDLDAKKITIKHGEIKNLDMPGMTMVFQVKDPAMLNTFKAGDKVRFKAEKTGGAFVVTNIQPAK